MVEGTGVRCVFCETTTGKRSGEHLLRRWFNGRIVDIGRGVIRRQIEPGRDDVFTTMKISPFDVPINDVCKDCNESWLNAMEGRVGDLIVDLANFDTDTIPKAAARDLAAWCFKTALVRTCMDRNRGWLAPQQFFAELYATRDAPVCPARVRVHVARCEDPSVYPIGRSTVGFLQPVHGGNHGVDDQEQIHLVTFNVGFFSFLVSMATSAKADRMVVRGMKGFRQALSGRMALLWPYEFPGDLVLQVPPLSAIELRYTSALIHGLNGNPDPPLTGFAPDDS